VAIAQHTRLGKYEIIGSLARGAMAELFLARLPEAGGVARQVVIKRVLPELARDRAFVDRFIAQARIAAALDHQNIVHVHEVGQDDDGHFIAMERLHGGDVGSILSVVRQFGSGLPLALAIEIARGACAGLHHAHERRAPSGELLGLVHRDITPHNLFVTFDGAVKLLDFGIGTAAETMPALHAASGARRDRLPYMSPEQVHGEPLDRRSDVFSLSAVLWEMTVGERPPHAAHDKRLAFAKAIVGRNAPRPSANKPGYPPELERVVMRGLGRDPLARHATAAELQAELEAVARTLLLSTSARELAMFMAEVFPGRLKAWQGGERRTTGSLAISPRHSMLLPPEPMGTSPVSRPEIALPVAPVAPPVREAAPRRARWIAASLALVGLALAAAIIFVSGRSRSLDARLAATASSASPAAPDPEHLVGEDAHWFGADDYLVDVRGRGYQDERLDDLTVARMLKRSRSPGERTWFSDTNGKEFESEHYFRTRVARPADLTIGGFALCHAHRHERRASKPSNRNASLSGRWMLGRITEVSRLDAGVVSVANVECEVAGVRVIAD
jgi:serine/threonine protein kinase